VWWPAQPRRMDCQLRYASDGCAISECPNAEAGGAAGGARRESTVEDLPIPREEVHDEQQPVVIERRQSEPGFVTYAVDVHAPLKGRVLRVGEVWYFESGGQGEEVFGPVTLRLYSNGLEIVPRSQGHAEEFLPARKIALSPFTSVQACRFHSKKADSDNPWTQLFKISIIQHSATHIFATTGAQAGAERAHWVAEFARVVRNVTLSVLPRFELHTDPLQGSWWTATRLCASHALLNQDNGVSVVFCELHAPQEGKAALVMYEDSFCRASRVCINIDLGTIVLDRIGVDSSCLSVDGHNISLRTCAEKKMWLRAISNVKMKIKHGSPSTTPTDLRHFRSAIREHGETLAASAAVAGPPLLARAQLPQPPEPVHQRSPRRGSPRRFAGADGDASSSFAFAVMQNLREPGIRCQTPPRGAPPHGGSFKSGAERGQRPVAGLVSAFDPSVSDSDRLKGLSSLQEVTFTRPSLIMHDSLRQSL